MTTVTDTDLTIVMALRTHYEMAAKVMPTLTEGCDQSFIVGLLVDDYAHAIGLVDEIVARKTIVNFVGFGAASLTILDTERLSESLLTPVTAVLPEQVQPVKVLALPSLGDNEFWVDFDGVAFSGVLLQELLTTPARFFETVQCQRN